MIVLVTIVHISFLKILNLRMKVTPVELEIYFQLVGIIMTRVESKTIGLL